MKINIILSALVFYSLISIAQKPAIDTNAINTWTRVKNKAISNDGKIVSYVIDNLPLKSKTLVVQPVDKSWKKEIADVSNSRFSADNHWLIYVQPNVGLFKQVHQRDH